MRRRESQESVVIQVFMFRDGRFCGTECFAQRQIEIGRDPKVDLPLETDTISRRHARVTVSHQAMVLEDLGSANGTKINGQRVDRAEITSRDEVALGGFTLKFKALGLEKLTPVRGEATRTEQVPALRGEEPAQTQVGPPIREITQTDVAPVEALPSTPTGSEAMEAEDSDDDDDEREETERYHIEPFSLLSNLVRDNPAPAPRAGADTAVVEIIVYDSEKRVVRYDQAARRRRRGVAGIYLRTDRQGRTCLRFGDGFMGGVISGGRTLSLKELRTRSTMEPTGNGTERTYLYPFAKGDYANLVHPGGGAFLRFVRPPALPRGNLHLDQVFLKCLGSAALLHLVLFFAVGLFSPPAAAERAESDRFAKAVLPNVVMEKPIDEVEVPPDLLPAPTPPPEAAPPPAKQVPLPPPPSKPSSKPSPGKAGQAKPAGHDQPGSGGGAGLMMALAHLPSKNPDTLIASVTNVDAVRVPGGKAAFKVSGAVVKAPTSEVLLSLGKGPAVKTDIDIFGPGGKGRRGHGTGPGELPPTIERRVVRAVVVAPPVRPKPHGIGWLSPEEIDRVVKRHLHEIQACYERALLLKPGLTGRVQVDWRIELNGQVSQARVVNSTLPSPVVESCMLARIRTWVFPQPKKGYVVVGYPFTFSQVGQL